MAQIPMGNAGRAVAGGVPMLQPRDEGGASARATEGLLSTAQQVNNQLTAENTRLADEERRRQESVAEAAARARDTVQLQNTEDALTDLHDEVGGQVLRGEIPKDKARTVLAERAKKITDEALPGFREQTRGLVQPRLNGTVLRLDNAMRRTVEQKDRQDVTADMGQRLERLSRKYAADPAAAETEAMATFDTLGPFSTMNAAQLASARQKWKEEAQFTAGFSAVSAGRADRKALAEAEKIVGGLPDLDPQRRAQLLDRAQAYRLHLDQQDELRAARNARAAEAYLRKAEAEFNTFQTLADKGGVLDPAYIDRVSKATAGTPYQAGVVALAQQAKEGNAFATQPLAVQRATLDALDSRIASEGRNPALDKHREKLARLVTLSEADYKRDAMRAALERGVITELQPLNLSGGVQGLVQQLQARVTDADKVRQVVGASVSPLTADEAGTLGRMLTTLPPDQKGNAVALLAGAVPAGQLQALAIEIDKQDRPLALAMAVGSQRTTQGRTTAELILRGQQAIKDKSIKEEKGAEFGVRAQIAKEVGDSLPGQAREDVIDAARLIYLGKQALGETMSTRGAVALAVGGPIIEHNGRRLPVPADIDADTLQQRLNKYPAAAIAAQAPDGYVYLPGGRPMGVPEFLVALPSAQLEPAGLGRYMVRSGGSRVMNERRQPIMVEIK